MSNAFNFYKVGKGFMLNNMVQFFTAIKMKRIEQLDDLNVDSTLERDDDPKATFIESIKKMEDKTTESTVEKESSLSDYMVAHNYGRDDFGVYSQDPAWRSLMKKEYPDFELPPLTQESAFKLLSDYMSEHNYGPDDFETYSQVPQWRELQSAAYPDFNLPPLDPPPNPELSKLDEIKGWLSEINPNFDEFDITSPYCNNCGSCSYAVYRRFEGDTSICATAENIGYNSEMEKLTGMKQVSMSPTEIEQSLLEQGNGAHAIIGIDRSSGPGHWFNAVNVNGKIYAIDGQSNEILDWPPDYGDVVNWEMSVKNNKWGEHDE